MKRKMIPRIRVVLKKHQRTNIKNILYLWIITDNTRVKDFSETIWFISMCFEIFWQSCKISRIVSEIIAEIVKLGRIRSSWSLTRIEENSYRLLLEKQGDLRKCSNLIAVTQMWHVTPWVSRAPPNPPLPAFLGPNGIFKPLIKAFQSIIEKMFLKGRRQQNSNERP